MLVPMKKEGKSPRPRPKKSQKPPGPRDIESLSENIRAANVEDGSLDGVNLTNAELKQLLDKALVRFGNWKVQMETDPNPRMIHSLKSMVSIIDTISRLSDKKITYSYKELSEQMSLLVSSVAGLNTLITSSLSEDDRIDDAEEESINTQMMEVIRRTVELIRLVQQAFGVRNKLLGSPQPRRLNLEEPTQDRPVS